MASPYSSRYYEGLKEDSAASARETVPLILGLFPARSVVDVGCGSGTWARAYLDAGCDVLGIDGNIVQAAGATPLVGYSNAILLTGAILAVGGILAIIGINPEASRARFAATRARAINNA